jgi:hypothetical protein
MIRFYITIKTNTMKFYLDKSKIGGFGYEI